MSRKIKGFSNDIELTDEHLIVNLHGIDKLLSLKSHLKIPLSHLRGATIDKGALDEYAVRFGGTRLPDKWCGRFYRHGEKLFYNIERHELPVVIVLADEFYDRLVLGVEHPRELVDQLNNL